MITADPDAPASTRPRLPGALTNQPNLKADAATGTLPKPYVHLRISWYSMRTYYRNFERDLAAKPRFRRAILSFAGTAMVVINLTGCSASEESSAVPFTEAPRPSVSITTFAKAGSERIYLAALHAGVRFEERNGCLYVGDDQSVWFFGTTVRLMPGSAKHEVLDSNGRKLAETGTTIRWGGGQVSAAEAEAYNFADKLQTSNECKQRGDNYWLVGKIESPLFETDN